MLTLDAYGAAMCLYEHTHIRQSKTHTRNPLVDNRPASIEFFKDMSAIRFGYSQSIIFDRYAYAVVILLLIVNFYVNIFTRVFDSIFQQIVDDIDKMYLLEFNL